MVVWVGLSQCQRDMYVKYLGGESVREILDGHVSSPLAAIAHLKKVRSLPVFLPLRFARVFQRSLLPLFFVP